MAMSKCKECGKPVSTLAKTCPSCGVPKPTKKTKNKKKTVNKKSISRDIVPNIKNYKKNKDKIWVHCRNYKCRDYTQMYQMYEDYLNLDKCHFCNSKFMEAKLRNGKPIMPTDGIYDKLQNKQESYSSPSTKSNTSQEKDAFTKLMDGELDLATAFWGFGVVGTMIVGFICGWLSEAYSKWWLIPYIIFVVLVIDGLWAAARNYKIEQVKKKQSEVWGFLVQAFCVMGGLGLFTLIKDTFF